MFTGDTHLPLKDFHRKKTARSVHLFVGDFGEVAADPHFGCLGELVAYRVSIDPAQFVLTYGNEVKAAVNIGSLWLEIFCISGTFAARSQQAGLVLTTNYDPNEVWNDRVLQIWCRSRMLTSRKGTLPRNDIVVTLAQLARSFADGFAQILGASGFNRTCEGPDVPYLLLPSGGRGRTDFESTGVGRVLLN